MLLIVNIYGGFMEGLEGKEERSFLHVLCWQYGSNSLRQMVITLVLRILPLQSWTWHFLRKSSHLPKQSAPLGATKCNKRNDQHVNNNVLNIQVLNPPEMVSTIHLGAGRSKESYSIRPK